MACGQKGILIMHKHKWECSDVPGVFSCTCQAARYYDRLTGRYEVVNV
jgi:hypothetical protein